MKKILTVSIVSALLTVLPAKAQLQFGFKGGINVTEMSFDENVFKSSNRLGYFIGPTVKFGLPITGIGIDISGLILIAFIHLLVALRNLDKEILTCQLVSLLIVAIRTCQNKIP